MAPERPQPPAEDPLAQAARANVERGDYLAAAQLYLSESKTAPEKQRIPLRLSAAEYLAQGQLWEQMTQVLANIDAGRLDPVQQNRYLLLDAQRALADHQPDVALKLLQKITSPESLPNHGQRYYQLRAEAYAMTGNALEAARQLIWLDGLLEDQQQKLENQYRIWEQLSTWKTFPYSNCAPARHPILSAAGWNWYSSPARTGLTGSSGLWNSKAGAHAIQITAPKPPCYRIF